MSNIIQGKYKVDSIFLDFLFPWKKAPLVCKHIASTLGFVLLTNLFRNTTIIEYQPTSPALQQKYCTMRGSVLFWLSYGPSDSASTRTHTGSQNVANRFLSALGFIQISIHRGRSHLCSMSLKIIINIVYQTRKLTMFSDFWQKETSFIAFIIEP